VTRRERQLLEWIRENPCISQQELADKAGITRSSAAVHISNLMRKGYIAGRGYLLREAPYIAVVGGVNMDIGAVSDAPLVARDSNPGRVTTSLGGVGRNIAHNLCLLGEQVSMITVLGQDSFAQSVRENAADIGLDLSHSATIPGGRTGTYLFIDGCDGDMALAVNDMAIYEHITPEFLRQHGITALVLDVDNTLTGDGSQQLDATVQQWLDTMRAAGVRLTIVSNNTAARVRPFADRVGLAWVPLACKPLPVGLAVARRRLGVRKNQMAMVGDQIFTDRLAAGLYGIPCLYTMPRGGDHQRGVQFKRRFEPYWLDRYYQKGGRLYE